jgi:hypothetical protein
MPDPASLVVLLARVGSERQQLLMGQFVRLNSRWRFDELTPAFLASQREVVQLGRGCLGVCYCWCEGHTSSNASA